MRKQTIAGLRQESESANIGDVKIHAGDPQAVGLRERKKARMRDDLRAAATDLFVRQGFDHTTVEAIAAACDVSPRTFFRYFPTKEDVLFGDSDERCQELLQRLAARPPQEGPFEAVRAAFEGLVDEYSDDRGRLLMRKRILHETPSLRTWHLERQQSWDQEIVAALRERPGIEQKSPMELRLVAGGAMAALRAALDTWLEDGGDLGELVDQAFVRVGAGLG
jgi:AcrR family transcriptional regulator